MSREPKLVSGVFRERKLKAWRFVERVLDIHHELQREFHMHLENERCIGRIQNMGVDEMMEAAFRFLTMRDECHQNQRNEPPTNVDIGYHYTRPSNFHSIVRSGLLSRDELVLCRVTPAHQTGSNCGRGIYVAADPISFASKSYGRLCIMTARGFWGARVHLEDGLADISALEADTILIRPNDYRQFAVLKRSAQCLPMICFDLPLREADAKEEGFGDASTLRKIVFEYHKRLQALLDEILDQKKTNLPAKDFGCSRKV